MELVAAEPKTGVGRTSGSLHEKSEHKFEECNGFSLVRVFVLSPHFNTRHQYFLIHSFCTLILRSIAKKEILSTGLLQLPKLQKHLFSLQTSFVLFFTPKASILARQSPAAIVYPPSTARVWPLRCWFEGNIKIACPMSTSLPGRGAGTFSAYFSCGM